MIDTLYMYIMQNELWKDSVVSAVFIFTTFNPPSIDDV